MKVKARIIAFYLPQFHPFKENDEWWGKGFTEWTNVGKAKPLFRGHYQPRVPADLGYYDLRLPIVREQQAELARNAGIEGFCYWHYWFGNGKTLLANIFDEVVKSGKPDFPFCLGWANHDWSRRTWNSDAAMQKDLELMKQEYPGEQDHINHFFTLLPAFKDKRYIRVDGKPLFAIYDAEAFPDVQGFMKLWTRLAQENGLEGFHFIAQTHGWASRYEKVLNMGFDALTLENFWLAQSKVRGGYIPQMLLHKFRKYFPNLAPLDKYSYKKILKHWFTEYDKMENGYPTIIPNWDRSPRGGRRAVIYTGSTPELFKKHVEEALDLVKDKQPEHRIIFLKSWNEWAEGNYMEPDLKFGHGYLDALRDAIVEK